MSKGLLDKSEIEVACPECGKEHKETIGRLRKNPTIMCSCGTRIEVDGRDLDKSLGKIDQAFDNLIRKLR